MPRKGSVDGGLFQRDGLWWVRWGCAYGHEHKEKIGTAKGMIARDFYAKCKLQVKTEGYCLTEAKGKAARERPVLFQDAASRYLTWARQERPQSFTFREKALKHLLAAFGPIPMKVITVEQVETYIRMRRDADAAPGTVNRERSVIGHTFKKAATWKPTQVNPIAGTDPLEEPEGKPRPITPDEEAWLFSVLPARYPTVPLRALRSTPAYGWASFGRKHGRISTWSREN